MPEPASPASEPSKAVPVGEPPTPEGWPRIVFVCDGCGHWQIEEGHGHLHREPVPGSPELGWMQTAYPMVPVRVAPVGGAGVRLTDEEARACLSAISDNDWAYYIADQGAEFLDALKAKLRASVGGDDG